MVLGRISFAGAVIALAGCSAGLQLPSLPKLASSAGTPTAPLLGGAFMAASMDGYCVDPNGSRPKKGFAIMAPCSILGVDDSPLTIHAVVTLQVGDTGSAIVSQDPAAFSDYLNRPNGPLLLSRSGDAETVNVRAVFQQGDYVTVYFVDEAPAVIDGLQESEWRAFVDIGGRLVTVAVRGLDEVPLSEQSGALMLRQSVNAVVEANADQSATDS